MRISPALSAVLLGPVTNFSSGILRRAILPFCRDASSTIGLMRDQAGRAVGRRRCIDDIAADRRLRADLIVGEPHRAARHAGQRARKRRIVEKTLDRGRGADAHMALGRPAARCSSGIFVTSIRTGISTSPARPSRAHGKVSVAPAMSDSGRDGPRSRRMPRRAIAASGIRRRSASCFLLLPLPASGRGSASGDELRGWRRSITVDSPHPVGFARPTSPRKRGEVTILTPPRLSAPPERRAPSPPP